MAPSIPQEFIRELVETADVVSLIDSYVPLKKKGKDHWGQCPFCDDGKHPSFSVSAQKQFYYCFKCSETGNVVSFLQAYLGKNFIEAIEILATKAGLQIPYKNHADNSDKKIVFEILEASSIFFQNNLSSHNSAESCRAYLQDQRKISAETCGLFNIGYALNSWSALSEFLLKKRYNQNSIIKSGMAKENKDGKLFDIFRNRIMFPIRDSSGRTVGFGGRVMKSEDQPKYLNTGDTIVFKKSSQLYGFYESNRLRKDITRIYVVEGYLDVISMFEHGINYSVATLGIASNSFHVQKILQLVNEVIFCFDGDEAGRGAAWNALKNSLPVLKDDAEMKFLFLPEGEDPASLLEKEDKEMFLRRNKEALILSDYFIKRLKEAVGSIDSLEKKASLAAKAMTLLQSMPDCFLKNLLEQEVSDATGLKEEEIRTFTVTTNKKNNALQSKRQESYSEKEYIFSSSTFAAKALIVLIQFPRLAAQIEDLERFRNHDQPEVRLFIKIVEQLRLDPEIDLASMMVSLTREETAFLGKLMANSISIKDTNILGYLTDCLTKIEHEDSSVRISQLKSIKNERNLTDDEVFELQQQLVSNLHNLTDEDKLLLKSLSQ